MSKIIPAVLSQDIVDYQKAIRLFESFEGNDSIHIDVMDGDFVPTKSAKLEEIIRIPTKLKRQVHLMMQDPFLMADLCIDTRVEEVAIHADSGFGDWEFFEHTKTKVLLALNPDVKVADVVSILPRVDGVLIMTVVPGKQGQGFLPENLDKIVELKNLGFGGKIVVDGGINEKTLPEVLNFGADEFVVGSGIVKKSDPNMAFLDLNAILEV